MALIPSLPNAAEADITKRAVTSTSAVLAPFDLAGELPLLVDNEIVYRTYRIGTSPFFFDEVRAADNTIVQAHTVGTLMYQVVAGLWLQNYAGIKLATSPPDIIDALTYPPVSAIITHPNYTALQAKNTNYSVLDFVDGGPPAEVEALALAAPTTVVPITYGTNNFTQAVATKLKPNALFQGNYNSTTGFFDLTIEAPVHSEFGDLTSAVNIPAISGFRDTDGSNTDRNFYKPPGYVTNSYDFGWGVNVIPPYEQWWVYPYASNGGQTATSARVTYVSPYRVTLTDHALINIGSGFLQSGGTLNTNVIDSVYGQLPIAFVGSSPNPYSANNTIAQNSVTTVRLIYNPIPTTTYARVGMALMEISSRRILGFGHEVGSTRLNLWTWTTVDDDSLNSFSAVESMECNLPMDNIFLRIYITTAGAIKFMYSADNVRFWTAFQWANSSSVFTSAPSRVGIFAYHLKSFSSDYNWIHGIGEVPQGGVLSCPHWDQYSGTGIVPETYAPTLIGKAYTDVIGE